MVSKNRHFGLPILLSLILSLGIFIGYTLRSYSGSNTFLEQNNKNTVQEVLEIIENKYVDTVSVDSINQITINELLSHLDPHSVYIPPQQVQFYNNELAGNFVGIGIEFQIINDTLYVAQVLNNSPAAKAGIAVGDKIIAVNDTTVIAGKNMNSDEIRALLLGNAGSKVNVSLIRNNSLKKITITRDKIPVISIDAAYKISPNTGYIKINKFAELTYEEFMQSLEKLQKEKIENLVLDLRDNGGGLLNEAVEMADEFLSDNKLIVYTEGEHAKRYNYNCKRTGLFEKGKLIVLINENSASASEVLAGALQDWDRATIIGTRSFGKGLVQQQFNLNNGGALRLTIAKYFTPLGRNIQKPYKNKTPEQYRTFATHNQPDSTINTKETYTTAQGKKVFGGGGILPDVVLKEDSALSIKIATKDLYKTAYSLFYTHEAMLKKCKTVNEIVAVLNTEIFNNNIYKELNANSVNIKNVSSIQLTTLAKQIKNLLVKFTLGTQAYIEFNNLTDETVLTALKELK